MPKTIRQQKRMHPFIGVDGEGGNVAGRHIYTLLRAGDRTVINRQGLGFEECAAFLSTLDTRFIYVSYFFDYDVTMICRSLPPDKIEALLDRESRTLKRDDGGEYIVPVRYGAYQFDYLPKKRFSVRRLRIGVPNPPWTHISDTGTFFQSSFVKALATWDIGTVEQRESIASDKAKRSGFTELTDETIEYNRLECELLAKLMERFRAICVDTGYVPSLWEGPGNMATAMFRKHNIPETAELTGVPSEVWRMAQAAYYGGRFETTAVGTVQGMVTQYDINSAYPHSATQLPCLVHGTWKRSYYQPGRSIGVYRVVFSHNPTMEGTLYNLPVRLKNGSIQYARTGEGWYWSPELDAAYANGTSLHSAYRGWIYVKNCECDPFGFVPGVYQQRLKIGKSGKGLVLKLGLNSLYGKLAQSIGRAPMANPIWSGLITAITRGRLIEAYAQAPQDCIMLATDGLFFTGYGPPLQCGKGLGEWDKTTHDEGAFIIQPGLYFVSSEMGKPKTRGVPQREVSRQHDEFVTCWASFTSGNGSGNLSVPVPVNNFIGLRLANARGKLDTAGTWKLAPKAVSFDWSTKREPGAIEFTGNAWRTYPKEGGERTIPYHKCIGNLAREMERLEFDDLPED